MEPLASDAAIQDYLPACCAAAVTVYGPAETPAVAAGCEAPWLSLAASASCIACPVLQEQVSRAQDRLRHALFEAAAAEAERMDAQRSLASVEADRGAVQRRCQAASHELSEKGLAYEDARSCWGDEVTAWTALVSDAKAADEASRRKAAERQVQVDAARATASGLSTPSEAARAEVARLHSLRSALEARRVEEAELRKEDLRGVQRAEATAQAVTAHRRADVDAIAQELEATHAAIATLEAGVEAARQRSATLQQEVALARHDLETLRSEGAAERKGCKDAVSRLDDIERRQRAWRQASITASMNRRHRGSSPERPGDGSRNTAQDDAPVGWLRSTELDLSSSCQEANLKRELEALTAREARLLAEKDRAEREHQEEKQRYRDSVERLRCKAHRYKAGCSELQHLVAGVSADGGA
eukprot:TRINITY_DN37600_c0_g2_i1.p1 TRINITY_DN37600_c0_g2~~TRINITY_DN37600_c0_g2_i1.p1  ORF type:complete len:450 (+),score=77.05 TRINITY_DN37600_c0_g2_i1:103-1350(+)